MLFVSNGACFSQEEEGFFSTPFGEQILDAGLFFITNPGDFLFDLHHDAMDYTPLPHNRVFGIHTNLLVLANPGLVNSISGKIAIKEGEVMPQVGLFGGFWKTIALDVLSNAVTTLDAGLSGWSAGFFIAKRVDPATRLFTHINYSRINLSVTLTEPLVLVEDVLEFEELTADVIDTYIFTGIEHTSGEFEDRILIAQTGYGIREKKIVAKILVHKGILEYGLTIYPEGLLVLHPVLNLQLRF